MATISDLEKRLETIESRNQRVEVDKSWETSLTRRVLLILFTYLSIGFYLQSIQIDHPWLNAIVPAIAFFFSTLTLPFFKSLWSRYFHR